MSEDLFLRTFFAGPGVSKLRSIVDSRSSINAGTCDCNRVLRMNIHSGVE